MLKIWKYNEENSKYQLFWKNLNRAFCAHQFDNIPLTDTNCPECMQDFYIKQKKKKIEKEEKKEEPTANEETFEHITNFINEVIIEQNFQKIEVDEQEFTKHESRISIKKISNSMLSFYMESNKFTNSIKKDIDENKHLCLYPHTTKKHYKNISCEKFLQKDSKWTCACTNNSESSFFGINSNRIYSIKKVYTDLTKAKANEIIDFIKQNMNEEDINTFLTQTILVIDRDYKKTIMESLREYSDKIYEREYNIEEKYFPVDMVAIDHGYFNTNIVFIETEKEEKQKKTEHILIDKEMRDEDNNTFLKNQNLYRKVLYRTLYVTNVKLDICPKENLVSLYTKIKKLFEEKGATNLFENMFRSILFKTEAFDKLIIRLTNESLTQQEIIKKVLQWSEFILLNYDLLINIELYVGVYDCNIGFLHSYEKLYPKKFFAYKRLADTVKVLKYFLLPEDFIAFIQNIFTNNCHYNLILFESQEDYLNNDLEKTTSNLIIQNVIKKAELTVTSNKELEKHIRKNPNDSKRVLEITKKNLIEEEIEFMKNEIIENNNEKDSENSLDYFDSYICIERFDLIRRIIHMKDNFNSFSDYFFNNGTHNKLLDDLDDFTETEKELKEMESGENNNNYKIISDLLSRL